MMAHRFRLYGSCAARDGAGVLVLGPPGCGKSDLVLRLLGRGFQLVADDQVELDGGVASAPAALAGLLETRGLGIMRLACVERAPVVLVVALGAPAPRLPMPECHPDLGVPVVRMAGGEPSAPDRVILALDCALGRVSQVAGAFAA